MEKTITWMPSFSASLKNPQPQLHLRAPFAPDKNDARPVASHDNVVNQYRGEQRR